MPGNVTLLTDIGATQRRLGLFDESIASFLLANELDPASPQAAGTAAATMVFNREYDRAQTFLLAARKSFACQCGQSGNRSVDGLSEPVI